MREVIGIIIIPAIAIIFAVIVGVVVNLLLPKMEWESEVEVVKQSASAMVGGIGGTLLILICAAVVLLVPTAYIWIAVIGVSALLVAGTLIMYCKNIAL